MGISPPSIATLRSIYGHSLTLLKHQLWTKTYLGLRDLEQGAEIQLTDALRVHAQEATHRYTNPAMAIARLLGFDLCPRLRDLAERKLHLPRVFKAPEGLEAVTARSVSLSAIERGWDELLRLAAS